jgi:sensor c-di-GMP phosphodiesterase-like protein
MSTPEMTAMLPVLTIIGSLVGAFGGVWLGRYLERGNEAMKWRRDRVLDAYSEFLRAVDMAVEASWMAFGAECGTEEHNKQKRIAFEKITEMQRISDRILLLSSDAVQAPFTVLTTFIRSELVFTLVDCPKVATNFRKELNKKLSEALARFIKSARDDLGIHPRALN